jgi:hypothetical protein
MGMGEVFTGLWLGVPMGKDQWEDLGLDGDNIKMDFREIGIDGPNWIRLAQYRFQWRAFEDISTIGNSFKFLRMRSLTLGEVHNLQVFEAE